MLDIIKTKYGEVEIEAVEWHRGLIPLPSGRMRISDKVVEGLAKRHGLNKKWGWVEGLLKYCNINIYSTDFAFSYIEFLYPDGPDYGLSYYVRWVGEDIEDSDIEDFVKGESNSVKKFLLQKKRDIEVFLEDVNDVYHKMLDYVRLYIDALKECVNE